eukprot:15045-Heterococcus_DN1.PRE.1
MMNLHSHSDYWTAYAQESCAHYRRVDRVKHSAEQYPHCTLQLSTTCMHCASSHAKTYHAMHARTSTER